MPIETRMLSSIETTFKCSNISIDEVKENKFTAWGDKIYDRFDKIGWSGMYPYLIGLPSHSVHGNWQDLLQFHIKPMKDSFTLNYNWTVPRPQIISGTALYCSEVNKVFLQNEIIDCPERTKLLENINSTIKKINTVDEYHERFLVNKMNNGA